ncbi:MAG: murein hydrolase activator EnvC [Saprospiraceae bacterium]
MNPRASNLRFQKDIKKWISHPSNLSGFWSKRFFVIILLGIFCINFSNAQIRKDLEDRRRKLIKDIQLTSKLLNKTTKTKAAALDRYIALRKQVQQRELLVSTLQKEIEITDLSMNRASDVVESLTGDIDRLEKEYGDLLRQAYRRKKNSSDLGFIFSSESINQGFQRWQYLKQYDEYRKKQAQLILETKETLTIKKTQLQETKIEKQGLIASVEKQANILSAELGDKSKLLRTLRKDEKRLKSELRKKRTDHEGLNKAIEKAIRKDMASRRKNERDNKANKKDVNKKDVNKKPQKNDAIALDRLTGDFRNNRGRLPQPVKNGVVTRRFGKQQHPTLPRVQITNNGIDIRTERNAKVFAVFEGKVVSKQFIPGYQNMLIVQHGDYYTVYSNLGEVFVKKGDQVGTMENIGTVAMDRKSNVSEVHFEVWRDKARLNPEDWVR